MESGDSNTRRTAAESLAKVKAPEAIDALAVAVKDKIRRVRLPALQALIMTEDKRALPHIAEALKDLDYRIAATASKGLINAGKPSVKYILGFLNHDNWKVRLISVETLGNIGDKATIPALVERLVDEKIDVRRKAASALKQLGDPVGELIFMGIFGDRKAIDRIILDRDPRSVPLLLISLKNKEWKARKFAAFLLGKMVIPEAVEPLIETLHDNDAWVRQSAVEALGKIKNKDAVQPLMGCLNDIDPKVRAEAATSLGILKAKEAAEKIIKLLKDGTSVREKAAEALGEIGEITAVPPLVKALKDPADTVRINSAKALGKIADTRGIDPLKEAQNKNLIESELAEDSIKMIVQKNKPVAKKFKKIICTNCLTRFKKYPRKLSFFHDHTYYACRVCKGWEHIEGAGEIIAVLDRNMDLKMKSHKNKLHINWFQLKTPFDFEKVHIIDADEFEVEEFVMKMRNDSDDLRLKNLKNIQVMISKDCNLPKLKINLLENIFGKVGFM